MTKPKKKRTKKSSSRYVAQFKTEAVRAVKARGSRTIGEVAESLGVAEALLHSWKSRMTIEQGSNDRGETMEQEVRRLRRELVEVKKDRDIVEKSIAVFVKERKQTALLTSVRRRQNTPLLVCANCSEPPVLAIMAGWSAEVRWVQPTRTSAYRRVSVQLIASAKERTVPVEWHGGSRTMAKMSGGAGCGA